MLNFTAEQVEAAKAAKSPEELVTMAKEAGQEITLEQANLFLASQKQGELADEELENVAGGSCYSAGGGGEGNVTVTDHGSVLVIEWVYNEKMNNIWYYIDMYSPRFIGWGVNVEMLKKDIEDTAGQLLSIISYRYYSQYAGEVAVTRMGTYKTKRGSGGSGVIDLGPGGA